MTAWRDIGKNSWSFGRHRVVGLGGGIGKYQTSYAVNLEKGRVLNGKISADLRIVDRHVAGAGLICRADDYWSFVAFYTAPSPESDNSTIVRLSVFKQGIFSPVAILNEPARLDDGKNRFSLEFLAGHLRGEIRTAERVYELSYTCPHIPFAGYFGLVKFYGAEVIVSNISTEETLMKFSNPPIRRSSKFEYDVFLCHSSTDKPLVLQIATEFRAKGITYWLDSEQIEFGDPITGKIEEGLRKSRYVVPCVSANLSRSGWPRAEYGAILNAELSGDSTRVVIPLKLDDSLDNVIPILLRDKRRVMYSNKVEYAEFLRFLLLR